MGIIVPSLNTIELQHLEVPATVIEGSTARAAGFAGFTCRRDGRAQRVDAATISHDAGSCAVVRRRMSRQLSL